jgi:hypothetical protein
LARYVNARSRRLCDVVYLVLSGTTTTTRGPELLPGLVGLRFSTVIALPTPNASRVIALRDLADVVGVQVVESYFDLAIRPRPPRRGAVRAMQLQLTQQPRARHCRQPGAVRRGRGHWSGTPVIVAPSLNQPLLDHPQAQASLRTLPG